MNYLIKKSIALRLMALAAFFAALSSFSSPRGGEGFEIYINHHLVMQRYGSDLNQVSSLRLEPAYTNGQVTIKYWHCGKLGKSRVIAIRDEKDHLLKQWNFADNTTPQSPMTFELSEIPGLKKGNLNTLRVYYTSSELPKGRLLTSFILGS